jgi:hypothetical protein
LEDPDVFLINVFVTVVGVGWHWFFWE